jgi:hypothetical protein
MKVTKRRKIDSLRPPQEIRGNTKVRRAWLAEMAARVNAEPCREAKIVGVGSYQEVSVWAVETADVAEQVRGTCQACGRVQAVLDKGETPIAKHGYEIIGRGRGGYFIGTCHGSDRRPAELSVEYTWHCITNYTAHADHVERDKLPDAQQAAQQAVKPSVRQPDKVRDAATRKWRLPDTPEGRAWSTYWHTINLPRALAHEITEFRDMVAHLRANVLPRYGQPLYQVPKP